MIQDCRYSQLKNYFTQLMDLSNKDGFPTINQALITSRLDEVQSTVCRFMGNKTKKPKKMLNCFIAKYPLEFQKWPAGKNTIERILQVSDAMYFLGRPTQPQPQHSIQLTPHVFTQSQPPSFSTTNSFSISSKAIPIKPESNLISTTTAIMPRMQQMGAPSTSNMNAIASILRKTSRLQKLKKRPMNLAPIAISYRGHDNEKDGAGMLFDHMRFQFLTNFPTQMLVPPDKKIVSTPIHKGQEISDIARKLLTKSIEAHSAALPFGHINFNQRKIPPVTQDCADLGLLIIPGRVRKIENEPVRLAHEYNIIRKALNRGQPILGICAGAWRVFEQLFIMTKRPNQLNDPAGELSRQHEKFQTLIDVTDHCYGGGMIRLGNNGTSATYNVMIHDIEIVKGSILQIALKGNCLNTHEKNKALAERIHSQTLISNRLPVNSIHWKAVNPICLPLNIKISAISKKNLGIHKNTRQMEKMEPQENTIEAFENNFGAPIMGIQWHPEGYNGNTPHSSLLKYMVEAGRAYTAKRAMLHELKKESPS